MKTSEQKHLFSNVPISFTAKVHFHGSTLGVHQQENTKPTGHPHNKRLLGSNREQMSQQRRAPKKIDKNRWKGVSCATQRHCWGKEGDTAARCRSSGGTGVKVHRGVHRRPVHFNKKEKSGRLNMRLELETNKHLISASAPQTTVTVTRRSHCAFAVTMTTASARSLLFSKLSSLLGGGLFPALST